MKKNSIFIIALIILSGTVFYFKTNYKEQKSLQDQKDSNSEKPRELSSENTKSKLNQSEQSEKLALDSQTQKTNEEDTEDQTQSNMGYRPSKYIDALSIKYGNGEPWEVNNSYNGLPRTILPSLKDSGEWSKQDSENLIFDFASNIGISKEHLKFNFKNQEKLFVQQMQGNYEVFGRNVEIFLNKSGAPYLISSTLEPIEKINNEFNYSKNKIENNYKTQNIVFKNEPMIFPREDGTGELAWIGTKKSNSKLTHGSSEFRVIVSAVSGKIIHYQPLTISK